MLLLRVTRLVEQAHAIRTTLQDWPRHRKECIPVTHTQNYNMIATPPPVEQQLIMVSAILFSPEEGVFRS